MSVDVTTAVVAALRPVEVLLPRLEGVTGSGPQWRARCPAHGSRGRTLAIRELENGSALLHCHAGCWIGDVVAAVDLALADLFPRSERYDGPPVPARERWNWRDLLRMLEHETDIVRMAAEDVAAGRRLVGADLARLRAAHAAIVRIARLVRA